MSVVLRASLGPALEFMQSLWTLDHALSERAKKVATRFGITVTQRLVIRILGQRPGSSAGAVSRILHVHPSTLTPILQLLVDRGLVRRTSDPQDRRRAVLFLTKRGERLDTTSASEVDERVRAALARIAPAEVLHARHVLHAVAEALGQGNGALRLRRLAPTTLSANGARAGKVSAKGKLKRRGASGQPARGAARPAAS